MASNALRRGCDVDEVLRRRNSRQLFLVLGEQDLLLVAKVAEKRGAADFSTLGDFADRDVVEAACEEQLLCDLHDALTALGVACAPRGSCGKPTGPRSLQYQVVLHLLWYLVPDRTKIVDC